MSGATGIVSHPAATIDETSGHYRLRLASSEADMRAIFRLRFVVFNLELDEGLQSAYATGEDCDQFDAQCAHLLVEDRRSGAVIGTYRMQDEAMAAAGAGFYSANEFALEQLPPEILGRAIELGRACIDAQHRNTRVLFLLWRGLASYMRSGGHRYFFGCCSLTSQDPDAGLALYAELERRGHCDAELTVAVRPDFQCHAAAGGDVPAPRIPKLMRLYLGYGARIVSPPAIDREFSTIDYLALFDLESLDEQARRMFVDRR